jgi:hypothetical protein
MLEFLIAGTSVTMMSLGLVLIGSVVADAIGAMKDAMKDAMRV